jgi:hypothetical protein
MRGQGAYALFSNHFFVHISGKDFWLLCIYKVTNIILPNQQTSTVHSSQYLSATETPLLSSAD